eukprot:CAMPEP_0168578744 /NCGR_PEP_ID=MMETSP0413-20121227/21497_1 /TAXON_ID=136452 /ORGANISM="Filamoeba nolandi, Strain NC-AS-23-1" /LENGTH=765 /DNA_ID=CAMNT_0008612613 /DNA_START=36 /DNA_END=2334 /DNA_ORIENTATION=+
MSNQITLNIKTLDSNHFPSSNASVVELKTKIEQETGIPPNLQRVLCQGRVLKEDKTLDTYTLKDGQTLHLVAQPRVSPSGVATSPIVQSKPTAVAEPPKPSLPTSNLLLGTISNPDVPNADLPQLLSNVYQNTGQGAPLSTVALDNQDVLEVIHQLLQQSSNNNNTPTQPGLPAVVSLFQSQLNRISSEISNLSAATPQSYARLSSLLGYHATISSLLSNYITAMSTNNAYTDHPQQYKVQTSKLPSVQINLSVTASDPNAAQTSSTGVQPMQVSVPLYTVSQRTGTAPPVSQPAANPSNLLSTIASMIGNNNPAQPSAPSMDAFGQLFSNMAQVVGNMNVTQASATGNAPSDFTNAVNQMAQPSTANAPLNQFFGTFAQMLNNNAQPAPQFQRQSNAAALLSQTFNAVNDAMNMSEPGQPAPTVSSVIGSITQGMSSSAPTQSHEDTVIDEILRKVWDTLTLPEMLSIMSGNWTPFQRIHPVLKTYVSQDLLKGDVSNPKVEQLVDQIMASISDTFQEGALPQDIQRRVKNGYSITKLSLTTIRKHLLKLIQLILGNWTPTQTNPNPFSSAIKDWTEKFVEELVTILSQSTTGGVADAIDVIKYFLQDRLSFMNPEFAAMGTNMVTSYIMNTYSNTHVAQADPRDPNTWHATIAVDELRQNISQPQRPFSDAYSSGTPSKKRKTAKTTNPQELLQEKLKDAIQKVNPKPIGSTAQEAIIANVTQSLSTEFIEDLSSDIKKRLQTDDDFDPSRMPVAARTFLSDQ